MNNYDPDEEDPDESVRLLQSMSESLGKLEHQASEVLAAIAKRQDRTNELLSTLVNWATTNNRQIAYLLWFVIAVSIVGTIALIHFW
ncbi:MAG: hypothetical protein ABI647_09585 [Gemmatimonadota bacterium]